MNPVIPTIFSKSKPEFSRRFRSLVKISKNLQIDFMDGKFVRSKSVQISQIPNLKKYNINFEAHLMVSDPKNYVQKLKQKGFKKVIFHFSSLSNTEEINALLKLLKKNKFAPFIAINPEIEVESIIPFLFEARGILFMGVHPGEEQQKFIRSTYKKIKLLRKINKNIEIQVDGGVNEKTIKKLAKLGVNYVNSGSSISEAENPREQLKKLNVLFNRYKKTR